MDIQSSLPGWEPDSFWKKNGKWVHDPYSKVEYGGEWLENPPDKNGNGSGMIFILVAGLFALYALRR
jgi:hypothetical protein